MGFWEKGEFPMGSNPGNYGGLQKLLKYNQIVDFKSA